MSIITSLLAAGTNNHLETAENANALGTDFVTAGVTGSIALSNGTTTGTGSYAVNAQGSPNMTVAVSAGNAWLFVTPTSQNSQAVRVRNTASANVTIAANATGSTKYDFVYISASASAAANPAVNADDVSTLVTSRSSSSTTDNGTPPTYGLLLAVVTVANGAASIVQANISDRRSNAVLSSSGVSQTTSWNSLGLTPTVVAANGNRSYSLTFPGTDLTTTLSPGMRLRTTRTVTAPTQCTSLNGSTQYYSKTSPAGMTFTDNFTISAWVKISSYALGVIVSRNATANDGFKLFLGADGRINLIGQAAAGASRSVTSYQSVPLNKWVHIAANLTMSSGTGNVYMDGVLVPSSVAGAATALPAQTGTFVIGADTGGTANFFNGKIAQAAIFNAVISGATLLTYISQTLAGTETSLISAYSFSNSINDLNVSNANNLTANGSAVATTLDTPFTQTLSGVTTGTVNYGIVQSVAFSTNTTVVVQVPEGCTIPTSGAVSAVSYSSNGAPYGFPKQRGKWQLESLTLTDVNQGATASGSYNNVASIQLNTPIGEWQIGFQASIYSTVTSGAGAIKAVLSTTNNGASDLAFGAHIDSVTSAAIGFVARDRAVSLAAATPYYLNLSAIGTTPLTLYILAGRGAASVRAENALL